MKFEDYLAEGGMPIRKAPGKGYKCQGKTIYREFNMIYWYIMGGLHFDIRELRKAVGLPKEDTLDEFWRKDNSPEASDANIEKIFKKIEAKLKGQTLYDAITQSDE